MPSDQDIEEGAEHTVSAQEVDKGVEGDSMLCAEVAKETGKPSRQKAIHGSSFDLKVCMAAYFRRVDGI